MDDATGTVKAPATDYACFRPTQIKSVLIAAPSTLSDPSARCPARGAEPRGALSPLLPEGTAPVLHILQNADASTAMHEMGHCSAHILVQIADKETAPFRDQARRETLKEWWAAQCR